MIIAGGGLLILSAATVACIHTIAGPDQQYAWTRSDDPNAVRVIREIDQQAMQRDLFDTIRGQPTRLIGVGDR